MKRTLSLLLTFVLLLGLLPGTVLADNTQSETPLPMYAAGKGGSKDAFISKRANDSYFLSLYYADSDAAAIPSNTQVRLEGESLGSVYWGGDGILYWDTVAAYPGMSGNLYATVNDVTYVIPVQVDRAKLGVYTVDKIDSDRVADNYVPQEDGAYKINYPKTGRSVYIIADDSTTISEVSCANDAMAATVETVENKKLVRVSVGKDFSGSADGLVKVIYNGGESRSFNIRFKGDKPSQGDGDTSDASDLPDGCKQLYFKDNGNYGTNLSTIAGGSRERELAFSNRGTAITKDSYTVWCDADVGSVTWKNDSESEIIWRACAPGIEDGATGYIYAYKNDNDTEVYALHVTATARPFKLYSAENDTTPIPMDKNGGYTVSYKANSPLTTTYYFRTTDASGFIGGENGSGAAVYAENSSVKILGSEILSNVNSVMTITLTNNYSGTLRTNVRLKTENITCDFEMTFTDGSNPGTGDGPGNDHPPQGGDKTPEGMGDLVREEHTVGTDEEHVFPAPFKPHDTAYFMVGDTKVYMVPAFSFGNFSETFGEKSPHGMALKDGEYDYIRLSPTFFVAQDGNNYGKVTKPELLTEIKKAVTSYSIDVDVVVEHPHFPRPATFPASYHYTADTSFTGYVYQMGHAHSGIYVATLTATVKNQELEQELTSQTRLEWMPSRQLWYTATSDDPIDEVNDFLYTQEYDANCSIMINLPAGEYEGFLETPAHLIDSDVFFYGETDNQGRPATVITGGLIGSGIPRDIHFKGNHTWVDNVLVIANEWGNGMPNQASLGEYNYVDFRNCILEGYNCALRTFEGNVKGADSCTFRNNKTAVFILTNETGITYQYNNFINNGTAFQIVAIGEGANLSNMKLTGSAFIDNDKDVVSKLSRNIFMPGAFCGYTTEQDTIVPRECITESASPNGVGKKQVFVYPQATSLDEYTMVDGVRTFTSFIYDTAFYESNITGNGSNNKGPMISRNLAATFPLPYGELAGNTFRVMDENTGKIMKVTFPALGGNS